MTCGERKKRGRKVKRGNGKDCNNGDTTRAAESADFQELLFLLTSIVVSSLLLFCTTDSVYFLSLPEQI